MADLLEGTLEGTPCYQGRPLMSLHGDLKITTAEYDIMIIYIEQACIELGVNPQVAAEVRGLLDKTTRLGIVSQF
jgi:truncated hemoglobin YjbI